MGKRARRALSLGLALGATVVVATPAANAVTNVILGNVSQFTGPGGLDLSGNMVYAVNFSNDDPDLVVNGVTFLHDRQVIPGATFTGPNQVTPWQTKPEYGATTDDNNLEQIMHDIRWANAGAGQILAANLNVTTGNHYKLQVLISGNHSESRVWDITIDGQQAVDEITSLGLTGTPYNVGSSTVWTYQFKAPDSQINILMGNFFGANDGGDRNPIWQGLTLEELPIPEPATFALVGLGATVLVRRRQRHREA
ncbi:MAG: PEP-CTERM sorting domain-containing protein [Phycisphaeraceae bacterium]